MSIQTIVRAGARAAFCAALLVPTALIAKEPASMSASTETTLGGAEARAVAAAYAGFAEGQPDADAANYEVFVSQEGDAWKVVFSPKPAAGDAHTLGGRTSLGREWTAWISRGDYSLLRKAFAR